MASKTDLRQYGLTALGPEQGAEPLRAAPFARVGSLVSFCSAASKLASLRGASKAFSAPCVLTGSVNPFRRWQP